MSTLYSIPGIYNVLDNWGGYGGMVPGPTGSATNNANALQAAIDAAQADQNGGIVLIPTVGASGQTGDYLIKLPAGLSSIITIP